MADEEQAERSRKVVTQWFDDIGAGNAEGAIAAVSEDLKYWTIGEPGVIAFSGWRTKSDWLETLKWFLGKLPNGLTFNYEIMTVEDDRVAVVMDGRGTLPDGRVYHNYFHNFFRVEDGLIMEIREYMDTMHFVRTLMDDSFEFRDLREDPSATA